MSTQRKPEYIEPGLSETAVHEYLRRNPDFFERHATLLGSLRLPHVTGGTVSLVERQVSVLRQKDLKLERKLKELLEVARANDALAAKIHTLALGLLAAGTLVETLAAVEASLRTAFGADHSLLVWFGGRTAPPATAQGRFFRPIERGDPALGAFATFLDSTSPRCGQMRDTQKAFLFGPAADEVGSAALVPLGKCCEVGFLAIGSNDSRRFHPAM
ncbi:MAG TPA: DUF484 family protein, partial [Woeseiaceae bacterium]|nr:DUF484 family protein [Woeseiaceae bacterium]